MATKIFHGAPGSYKSSTVCWFELLEALKAGRLCVTNLQGIKTLEEISVQLDIVFPASSQLVRIASNNDTGRELIRNFYQWLPIGSFIFIDEIQDIYPKDASFKPLEYNYKGEGHFDEKLPESVVSLYHEKQRKIKSLVDITKFEDDLGLSIFDDRDYINYPPTLRECFMRHRHYNWDICLATPDIVEVAPFIRSVCEAAFSHTSKDSAPFPYFKRRPRVLEHSPKTNGASTKKGDIVTNRKIPLDVFKIYESTATGQSTKSGAGGSPITGSIVAGAIVFLSLFCFVLYVLFFRSSSADSSPVPTVSVINKNLKEVSQVSIESVKKASSASDNRVTPANLFKNASPLILPFSADAIYLSAISKVYETGEKIKADYVFLLKIKNEDFYVSSMDLVVLGYKISFKSDYVVSLSDGDSSRLVYFMPTKYEKYVPPQNENQTSFLTQKENQNDEII
jgi:zona occludens toxin